MAEKCNDKNCPHHGSLSCRGRTFTGTVIAQKMQRTAIVEWERRKQVQKYERYEKKKTKLKVHNPDCIAAEKGDIVEIVECRHLSKAKNFVIIKKAGKERLFAEKEEHLAEAKVKKRKKTEEKPKAEVKKDEGS